MKANIPSVRQAKTPTVCGTISTQKQQGHLSDPDARPLEAALPQAVEVPMTADKPTPDQPSGQVPNATPRARGRLTLRELNAIDAALSRVLAGEPETEDEDVDGCRLAQSKVRLILSNRNYPAVPHD